ncbi:hypothetical protein LOZ86_11665 [Pectobacterium parvum]|nr:hypothetical protein [Pectobacterium parvum]UFK37656.1 hypothetical protein LOZ86_11665 [Pectobacterium parvum]UVD95753.1 hypothetical protein NV347_11670 [Pectobacterium parvum]
MDKHGRIAVMVNNCFGNLPDALLAIADAESLLDQLHDYLWEESQMFCFYPKNKEENTTHYLYSASKFSHIQNRQQVEQWIDNYKINDLFPRIHREQP